MPRPAERELGEIIPSSTSSCTHPTDDYIIGDPALCFGRDLPERPPGSEAFIDSCGCGCSAAPDYPRRCREQCELAGGNCLELRFEEFPDYGTTLQQWMENLPNMGGGGLGVGQCSSGRRFIYTNNGFTREARIFTPDGAFFGLGTGTDDVEQVCWGQGYWPEPVRCERATLTEVIAVGLSIREAGETVRLPWAEVLRSRCSESLHFRRAVEAFPHLRESLTELALEAGFYDQSHFIRRFRALAGAAPGRVLGSPDYC